MSASGMNKSPPLHDMCCHSHLKSFPFSCMWTIDNFSKRTSKTKDFVQSSTFTAGENKLISWYMQLFPMGDTNEAKDHLSVFICASSKAGEIKATYKISILNERMTKENISAAEVTFSQSSQTWGWKKFFARDTVMSKSNGLLPDDILTLHCEGFFFTEINDNTLSPGTSNSALFKVPECTAFYNYGRLLESRKFSDFTIATCNEEIQVHKTILAAQSTVFAAAFDCKLKEEKQNRIEIIDVEPEVMHEMLHFIYTGEAPNIDKMAGSLLAAADKYDLSRLKAMCAASLFKTLTTRCAVDTLILADRHSEELLKAETIVFINKYAKNVITGASYKRMAKEHPYLIDEIFRASITTENNKLHEKAPKDEITTQLKWASK